MGIKVLFRHLQGEIQPFLLGKGSEAHMRFFQYFRYITLRKVQSESLTFRFTKIEQLINQVQQPFRILLHDVQVLAGFHIHLFLQYDIFQRPFYQSQRSTYLMSHIRKKVNFCMVYFPFFLLFKFLHLPAMLSITPSF